MTVARYALMALAITGGSLALAWPLMARWLEPASRRAALAGAALAVANTVAAHWLIRWSIARSVNVFMRAVLGGMVGRMGLMLAGVAAAGAWLDFRRSEGSRRWLENWKRRW